MNPSLTSIITEHFLTGIIAMTAILIILPTDGGFGITGAAIPGAFAVLAASAGSYVLGVILAHLSARIFEAKESKIYLKVIQDPEATNLEELSVRLRERYVGFNTKPLKMTLSDAEQIFGHLRYRLYRESSLKDRIIYYQTMIRVCRNSILPLFMFALALFIVALNSRPVEGLDLFLACGAILLAFCSYLSAVGYTEWLGYATLRGFLALPHEQPNNATNTGA